MAWILLSTCPGGLLLPAMEKAKGAWGSSGFCSVDTQCITMTATLKLTPFLSTITTLENMLPTNGSLAGQGENEGVWMVRTASEGSVAAFGRHLFTTLLYQSVSSCVFSHMPRQWVQICLVTWSIRHCPINNRHHRSCQEQLIRGWSVCLDPRSRNLNPIRWKGNELWTQFPFPEPLLQGACMSRRTMPTHRPFSFWGTSWTDLDWAHTSNRFFSKTMDSWATWGLTKISYHHDLCSIKAMRPKLMTRPCSDIPLHAFPSSPSSSGEVNKCSCLLPSFPLLS